MSHSSSIPRIKATMLSLVWCVCIVLGGMITSSFV